MEVPLGIAAAALVGYWMTLAPRKEEEWQQRLDEIKAARTPSSAAEREREYYNAYTPFERKKRAILRDRTVSEAELARLGMPIKYVNYEVTPPMYA